MALEMSLLHAPRIQQVAADGTEAVAQDEQQWQLYYTVQQALQAQQDAATAEQQPDAAAAEEHPAAAAKPAARAPQPSDPQKVLEKLQTARGELDVITDLITFVEQQQFLAVEGVHRAPPGLEERLRARSLRLAASRTALRGAGERLRAGLGALQAQAALDNRFLADLAELRRRWKLRRHAAAGTGAGGMFYADISLPLRGALAQGIVQEGVQCNIIQDTNGDACIVEAAAAGGRRRAVRGWLQIQAVLELKQQLLSWQVVQQMVAAQARQPQHEADPDGAVAAVQRMAAAAAAACQAALYAAVAGSGGGVGAGAGAMDVDAPSGGCSGSGDDDSNQQAAAAAAAGSAAAGSAAGVPSVMLSSAARDIQAALSAPGFQQRFEGWTLLLLSELLAGGSIGGTAAAGEGGMMLNSLLRWLHHAALCSRVAAVLQWWCEAGSGRSLRHIDSGEEFAAVWQLVGANGGGAASPAAVAPVLAIVEGSRVRLEGTAAAAQPAAAAQRGLSRPEFERAILTL